MATNTVCVCVCLITVLTQQEEPLLCLLSFFSAFISVFCQLLPASHFAPTALCALSLGVGLLPLRVCALCVVCLGVGCVLVLRQQLIKSLLNTHTHTPPDFRENTSINQSATKPVSQSVTQDSLGTIKCVYCTFLLIIF